MLNGQQELMILSLGVQSGVFEELVEHATAEDIARRLGWDANITRYFLECLYGYGFLERDGPGYGISDFIVFFGLHSSPYSQAVMLSQLAAKEERYSRILQALTLGPPKKRHDINEVFNGKVLLGMGESVLRGGLQQTVQSILSFKEVTEAKRMLDLGGGHAMYSISLTSSLPGLQSVIFDLPGVIENAAQANVSKHRADRISYIRGDFMTDPVGQDYDILLCSDVLHRPREELEQILEKLHSASNEGAMLFVKETHVDQPRTNRHGTFFSLLMSTYGIEQRIFPTREFEEIITAAGFEIVGDIPLQLSSDSSRLTVARRVDK